MSDNVKISVIIPCYNVEDYIKSCLDSIRAQDFDDYEVLIIDNGSTDRTSKIAEDYAQKHNKFKYISIEQRGPGPARSHGIKIATGEHLAFIDSDDTVTRDYLSTMYNAAVKNNADMVVCNYAKYYSKTGHINTVKFRKVKSGGYSSSELKGRLINDFTMRAYVWNKLFKKSLFDDNSISFPDMHYEDVATMIKLVHYAKKIVVVNRILYYYTVRDSSIIRSSVQKHKDYVRALAMINEFLDSVGEREKYKPHLYYMSKLVLTSNIYWISRMHVLERSAKGLGKNIGNTFKMLSHIKNMDKQGYEDILNSTEEIYNPGKI